MELDDWSGATIGAAWDGEVEVVVREIDGEREAIFVPRGIQRFGEEGFERMRNLQHLVMRLRELADELDAEVERARVTGLSWDSIGFCVGTTGEAARQRWTEPE